MLVAIAILLVADFVRLGAAPWNGDELDYARAGAAYIHGSFTLNPQHPLLAKLLFGAAEWIGGVTPLSVRLVSATAATAIGLGLGAVAARHWGWAAGCMVIVAWAVLPHSPVPVSRLGLLEPTTTLLMGASLVCGWQWWCRRTQGWAIAAGACAGLAAGAKLPGICALVSLLLFTVLFERSRRLLLPAALAIVTAAAAFALTYLPAGTHAGALLHTMVAFQLHHARTGHPIILLGHRYQYAPWWTMTYYLGVADGWLALAVLVGLSLAALLLSTGRDRQLATLLTITVLTPLIALSASPVQLPHYPYIITPWLLLLAASGVVHLWRLQRRLIGSRPQVALITAAAAVTVTPLLLAADTGLHAALARPARSYAALPAILRNELNQTHAQVAVWGNTNVARAYLGNAATADPCLSPRCHVTAIVIDPGFSARYANPVIQHLLTDEHFVCRKEQALMICLPRTAKGTQ